MKTTIEKLKQVYVQTNSKIYVHSFVNDIRDFTWDHLDMIQALRIIMRELNLKRKVLITDDSGNSAIRRYEITNKELITYNKAFEYSVDLSYFGIRE